ncbi:hypothetical protein MNV49_004000 [Pseudohyphozyma bogoriensis]|nr:hypothetical protein MNV49_004000 [Pseudohyphozyma bogoriensis]
MSRHSSLDGSPLPPASKRSARKHKAANSTAVTAKPHAGDEGELKQVHNSSRRGNAPAHQRPKAPVSEHADAALASGLVLYDDDEQRPATTSPTKQRRKPRPNRQRSPPAPATTDDSTNESSAFESSTPIKFAYSPSPSPAPLDEITFGADFISKSAPAANSRLRPRHHNNHGQYLSAASGGGSSADEWDMPVASTGPGTPVSNGLTWQQEEALKSASKSHSKNNSSSSISQHNNGGARSRNASGRGGKADNKDKASRAAVSSSLSESAPSGLNWQQQLLQSAPTASPQPTLDQPHLSPGKARRAQLRDEETFGLSPSGSSSALDDLFSPNNRRMRTPPHHHTPTKNAGTPVGPVEPRYAGPTFHNSPAPSTLPTPTFLLRRLQALKLAA